MTHSIEWVDSGHEPQNRPNPKYPDGIDLDMSRGGRFCEVALPYPAKRIGYYMIECSQCGLRVAISTAGRPDDPRSVKLSCKGAMQ